MKPVATARSYPTARARLTFLMLSCLTVLLLWHWSAAQAQTPSEQTTLPSTPAGSPLVALSRAELADTPDILSALEKSADPLALPVFEALNNGVLYADPQAGLLYVQGDTAYTPIAQGQNIALDAADHLNKVRVNNAIRSFLEGAMARVQIRASDSTVRLKAVVSLLENLTPETVEAIQAVRLNEKSPKVQVVMDTAIAMGRAQYSDNPLLRVEAVRKLGSAQYPAVRNLLNNMLANETEPKLREALFHSLEQMAFRAKLYSLLDQLLFGLSLGSVLLLAAIGLAITFGVMGVINMAHGEMMMLGAYTTYVVQLWMPNSIDLSLWLAIPLAFVVAGAVGVLIERLVIRHLHGRPLETLLATFGISLILQQAVRTIFSPLNRQVSQPAWMSGSVEINPELSITLNRLYIFLFALLVYFVLQLILKKTNLGLNVRAVSQNRNMAKSMGIRTARVDAMTFGLGSGIAGIAGVALSQLTNVGPNLGQSYIIDSFMVVVFGGVGNLLGTLVAAFSLGVANKFLEPVTGAVLASILVLVFLILFIQKRPKGLFPQKGRAAE
ncbi:MAG: urea ABC transporter permease subunit UrtB [Limnobacter sp.]|uniref:urea ABC transporter permease subunit UrtB n=1 Tax=Limnobacter sp. TaxID=2003368 RepID=UPI00391CA6AE